MNGSSVTPPISPSCPMPGSKECTSGRSITSTGHRKSGWRRTAGCLAHWAELERGQGRRPCFRADPGRPQGRSLSARDRVAPSLALVASAERIYRGRPRASPGRRPARPDRERRPAGQDQRRVAPPRTRRPAPPLTLSQPRNRGARGSAASPILRHQQAASPGDFTSRGAGGWCRSARRAVGGGEQVGSDSEQLRYSFQGGGGLDDDPPVLIIGQALAEVAEQERGALDADQVS